MSASGFTSLHRIPETCAEYPRSAQNTGGLRRIRVFQSLETDGLRRYKSRSTSSFRSVSIPSMIQDVI